jgi:hypothetical protein
VSGKSSPRLLECLVVLGVLAVLAVLILAWVFRPALCIEREGAWTIRCRNNLNQLGKGLDIYVLELGDNHWYPFPLGRGLRPGDFSGAEWLASLYWTGVVPDPSLFLCPASGDSNRDGRDLGQYHDGRAIAGRFGPPTVSYAGLHAYSLTDKAGKPVLAPIGVNDLRTDEPIASDDTDAPVNHACRARLGMNVLYPDTRVEFKSNQEVDVEHEVGRKGGLLWRLRN